MRMKLFVVLKEIHFTESQILLIIFRIALSLSFFWVLREISPFGQMHPSHPPAYLAHTSTVSLSLLGTRRVPHHCRLQSSRITNPPNGTVHSTPPLLQIAQEKP